jgi:hypothetical protein
MSHVQSLCETAPLLLDEFARHALHAVSAVVSAYVLVGHAVSVNMSGQYDPIVHGLHEDEPVLILPGKHPVH